MNKQNLLFLTLFLLLAVAALVIQSTYLDNLSESTFLSRTVQFSLEKNATDPKPVKLFLVGDVMLGRTVMTTALDRYSDPTYPFLKVSDRMREADIVFANLENPIVEGCPRHYSGFKFCADPKMVEGLVYAGVDVVTLANNHSRNYGQNGLEQTVNYLNNSGIKATGVGELVTVEKNAVEFGFLGFDFLTNTPTDEDFNLVKLSDKQVDVLVVGVHWGVEYKDIANEYQREWARKLVENGADLVVGHHPHWVQDVECFDSDSRGVGSKHLGGVCGGKLVFYSLGNFIFDQMWSKKTREGLVVEVIYNEGEFVSEALPIFMQNWAQPEFVEIP